MLGDLKLKSLFETQRAKMRVGSSTKLRLCRTPDARSFKSLWPPKKSSCSRSVAVQVNGQAFTVKSRR